MPSPAFPVTASCTTPERIRRSAICLARLGEPDRALAEEEAAIAIDPRDADARELRGGLLAQRGRIDEALLDLRAAVEIDSGNAPYRVGLARALIRARRLDEAEQELGRALICRRVTRRLTRRTARLHRPGTSSSEQPQNSNGRWSWTRRRMT